MGFKKCEPHVISRDRTNYDFYKNSPYKMVPDLYTIEIKFVDGKRTELKTKKVHQKSRLFYKMKFSEDITIWIDTINSQIFFIYIEGTSIKDGVETIYNFYNMSSIVLNSKRDIIKLFPKYIQRDFILKDLFKL
jgi:hypothetical protein